MADVNEIRLKHCNVGFATAKECRHTSLGFKKNYSVAPDSNNAHGCLVFGENVLDVIAAVELKLSSSSCMVFDRSDVRPDLAYKHVALGQAPMRTMDTLHCLARRGQTARHLPAVVLAAPKTNDTDADRLCCMEARIDIPQQLTGQYRYHVGRCVPFSRGSSAQLVARYDEAIAIYFRTMSVGLRHAFNIGAG
jgi:hypothetical protein